jgi:hypothetical protein
MPEHYTKNTVSVLKWCNTCGKKMMHQVYDGRIGSCLGIHVHGMSQKQEKQKKQNDINVQEELF